MRLHLEERTGQLRKAAKVIFTRSDASLYLVPYAMNEEYFYGGRTMAAGQTEDTVNFREQIAASANPKLSIHETGQVHVYASGQPKAGPVQIPPLADYRGEHLATVRWDWIDGMPKMRGKTKVRGPTVDCAFGVPPDIESGALLLHANGVQPAFRSQHVHFVFQVASRIGGFVFFAVTAVGKEPLGGVREGGVTLLAGFDPTLTADDPAEYLYLRGR
jgi:hypothetical protein